jgi:hypothetical protein
VDSWGIDMGWCCCLIHTSGHVEEIFNPLGVALGVNLESSSCHLTLDSSV